MRRRAAWVYALIGLAGCAAQPQAAAQRCPAGSGSPVLVVELFFGRSISGQGTLTDQQWAQFETQVVVPDLPLGFTVFDASGAWMDPHAHATMRESTKVLLVALPESADALAPVERIRDAYRRRFHQQSVGMTVAPACGEF